MMVQEQEIKEDEEEEPISEEDIEGEEGLPEGEYSEDVHTEL